ncbi:MAG: transglutaminase N-terminal domain-containing protein [Sphingomonadaceae bacterium]
MRLSIDHHTVYRFSEPQARVVQLLRVTPGDYAAQTVIDWRIDVDCDARLRSGRDGYGNATTMLYVDGPITQIALTVRGEVLTEDQSGVVNGLTEPLPPLFYTRTTLATAPDDATLALVRSVGASDGFERAHALNALVGGTLRIHGRRGTPGRAPADILESGHASVRDAAHVLAALGHAAGFPARIVAGHALHGPDRAPRQSAHYWTELHLARLGWVGFDPCSGTSPDESYVRVAVGLDGVDVTPVSGTRRGGGIEELDVDVRVDAADTQ